MLKILQKILAIFAKLILKKYKPQIIAITGSIGKTSAKEAIFAVLKDKFFVAQNLKNFNNEIGLPLSIIGVDSPGKSIFGWLKVFARAKWMIIKRVKYPEVLILEMGADHPGDIKYLVNIAKPHISVLTRIGESHLEFFKTVENVAKEKMEIINCLNKDDFAILNFDDKLIRQAAQKTKAQVISFGKEESATVRFYDLTNQGEALEIQGIKFKINYNGSSVPVFLPGVIGEHQIYSALIGASVGVAMGMNLIDISNGLKNYVAPKGRMNLIKGIKNSLLIDDTYNSSPQAAYAAVSAVANLTADNSRKVAIMGDMLELGPETEKAHFELGKKIAEAKYDLLIAVGQNRFKIIDGAKQNGLANYLDFENSNVALNQIQDLIQANDIVLIKGSQGSRMEKITKALMQEPDEAKDLLVRQSQDWLNK